MTRDNPFRQQVAEWAHDLLQQEFVIFDTETTGIGKTDEIVQLGVVDHSGEVLISTLVKPVHPISPEAQAVHGLTAAHLIDAPGFPGVYDQLAAVLSGRCVVVYNADFDRKILEQTCRRYKKPLIEPAEWMCAMKQYAQFRGVRKGNDFRWFRLTEACAHEAVFVGRAHSAVDDCVLTLHLIQKMAENYKQ